MRWAWTILVAAGLLAACGADETPPDGAELGRMLPTGSLRVATRNAPTTYYFDRDGETAGPEHDAAVAFAEYLGVAVQWQVYASVGEILDSLASGDADLAAAGLTVTAARAERVRFGEPYREVREQVVFHRKARPPRSVDGLVEREIVITARSSYRDALAQLKSGELPSLAWREDPAPTEHLLRQVAGRRIDCTVADSHIVKLNRRYLPELAVGPPIGEVQRLAWAVAADNPSLARRVDGWQRSKAGKGALAGIEARYYDYLPEFDFVDLRAFKRRVQSRYPKYRELFTRAAAEHGVDPFLLAAQGYQESHWDPKARSPTGVRGLMMLTRRTAGSLGVSDRLDPAQSIDGGARYLARMIERLPDEITGEDREFMALAAYNVGYGHLRDARLLAESLGRDPSRWEDLREVLPLLADKKYHRKLKYGYARGMEPVRYVQRIRNYRDILIRLAVDA